MPRFKVQYTHVEEIMYYDWVEAETHEEALSMVEEDPQFEEECDRAGLEIKDLVAVEEGEDDD